MRDIDIRKNLYSKLRFDFLEDSDTILINELGICQGKSRVDIAIINGLLHGYEIKSAKDNLNRLPFQVEIYNKVFDKITLVTSENHLKEAKKLIPNFWGIVIAEPINKNIVFYEKRSPQINNQIESYFISQFLWKEEVIDILSDFNLTRGVANKPRRYLWELLSNNLEITEISQLVRKTLKSRENWRPDLIQM